MRNGQARSDVLVLKIFHLDEIRFISAKRINRQRTLLFLRRRPIGY